MTDDTISQKAFDLIFTEEESSRAYYIQHYRHFEWPQGASGPTCGVGYDCGYVTRDEAAKDWAGIVPPATIAAIQRACGIKGEGAHAFVRAHGTSVTIELEQALQEFRERELPKWIGRVRKVLPNYDLLPPDCRGAIISLAYNRGAGGFDDPDSRHAEMRAIKRHMVAKEFAKIPDEFLAMRRLWPKGGGLWQRRGHEAALFKAGLVPAPAAATSPTNPPPATPTS